jgi:hypothetical protein
VIHKIKDFLRKKATLEINDRTHPSLRSKNIELVSRSDQLNGPFSPQLAPVRSTKPVSESAN